MLTRANAVANKMAFLIEWLIGLRDDDVFFCISSEVDNLFRHFAIRYLAVRCLEESKLIDLREYRKRRDKTDVRTFRCFDRTETAIVRVVHVADFESCAFAC